MSESIDRRDYDKLSKSIELAQHTVYKRYLSELETYTLVKPSQVLLDECPENCVRFIRLEELSCKKGEDMFQKLTTVYHASMSLGCSLVVMIDVEKINAPAKLYVGVRNEDDGKNLTKLVSSYETLQSGIASNFPGTKFESISSSESMPKLINEIFGESARYISSVSCVASVRDKTKTENKSFVQGVERLIDAMQGNTYTAVFIAEPVSTENQALIRDGYESIYTALAAFRKSTWSYNKNESESVMESLSKSFSTAVTMGTSYTQSHTVSVGLNAGVGVPRSSGWAITNSIRSALGVNGGLNVGYDRQISDTTMNSTTDTTTETKTTGNTNAVGTGKSLQVENINKSIEELLDRVDELLKRTKTCEDYGAYNCAVYFVSGKKQSCMLGANTYKALMTGEGTSVESGAVNFWDGTKENEEKVKEMKEYLRRFRHPVFAMPISANVDDKGEQTGYNLVSYTAGTIVSGIELPLHMGFPTKSVYGLPVIEHAEFGKEVVKYDYDRSDKDFQLGNVFCMGKETFTKVNLDCDSLTMHTFITGSTGAGKSNAIYEILDQLRMLYSIPFLVVEPAKGEYKNVFGQFSDVTVYGTNPKIAKLLKINPFSFPKGVHVLEHMDRLVEIFNVCWPMYAAMPAILKEAMEKAYISTGWNMNTSENDKGNKFPNFADLLEKIENVIEESKYSADSKGDYSGALMTRVRSLTTGLNGQIFTNDEISNEELFNNSVIVDLSRVGSSETKSLIMGLLVMKLNEYRMDAGKSNSPLSHITVLEEAHNLLKRTSTEQSAESSNLLGKSVELLANSIAEMRTYGEGFIIADQSPGLLDLSVIRNTNTKIILRLPEKTDRELVGFAAGLTEEQIPELAKLKKGVAAVYQNDWVEPVLVQIDKCGITEKPYDFEEHNRPVDNTVYRDQLINFLIQGRLDEKLHFDIDEIEQGLDKIGLSARNEEIVAEFIEEYRIKGTVAVWRDDNFRCLSNLISEILGVRPRVQKCVLSAADNQELSSELQKIVEQKMQGVSWEVILTLSQCFMKDMSVQKDEYELRQKIYNSWFDSVKEGRRIL